MTSLTQGETRSRRQGERHARDSRRVAGRESYQALAAHVANRFSAAYRIPLATLKNWEQGRRHPDAPAAAYLLAIKRKPKEIREAVAY